MKTTIKESIRSISARYVADLSVLVAVWALCIAHPMYQVLSAGATFFAAHNAGRIDILLFILLHSFAFPLAWALISTFAGIFSRWMRNILFAIGVGAPLALFLAKSFLYKPWSWLPFWSIWMLGALLLGLTVMIAIRATRWRPDWQDSTACIAAALLVVGLFVFSPSMRDFFFPRASQLSVKGTASIAGEKKPNIVVLLFDELSLIEMLDAKDHINERLFPNFAKLSRESLWFPNAYSMSSQTHLNVPSIFAGIIPSKNNLPPTRANYPQSIANLLEQRGYNIYAKEECTALFSSRTYREDRFLSDLSIVLYNVMLPPAIISSMKIPSVSRGWADFSDDEKLGQQIDWGRDDMGSKINEFFDPINNNEKFFAFYHFLLPHPSYKFLYNGSSYNLSQYGFKNDEEPLPNNRDVVNMVKMQYLQQACYADAVLGKVLEKMKQKRIYENSVLIVFSDHGIVNEQGKPRKVYSKNNIPYDIASVLVLMRIPGEKSAIKHDLMRHVDILPTLMDSLNWNIPWKMDGKSLLANVVTTDKDDLRFFGVDMKGEYRMKQEKYIGGYNDRLEQKKKVFSTGYKNAAEIYFSDAHHLGGSNVSDHQQVAPQKNIAIIEDANLYKNVILNGRFFPVYLKGSFAANLSLPIAFALNGKIYYVGKSFKDDNKKGVDSFICYFPPAAFVEGYNKIELFVPVRQDGNICLSPIKLEEKTARLIDAKTILYDRKKIKIQDVDDIDTEVHVFDTAKFEHGVLTLSGWAINKKRGLCVDELLLFIGDEAIAFSGPHRSRPDVAGAYKDRRFMNSGFWLIAPNISMKVLRNARLFAITGDIANELTLPGSLFTEVLAENNKIVTVGGPDPILTNKRQGIVWDKSDNHNVDLSYTRQGHPVFTSRGEDPHIYSRPISLDTKEKQVILIKVKVLSNADPNLQLFWITNKDPKWDESKTIAIKPARSDTLYRLNVYRGNNWKDTITRLRIDPGDTAKDKVELTRFDILPLRAITNK